MRISACMIAKNEENTIERCIHSYKSIVSEIIVVDTGSTDNTVNIAKKCGAKIFHFKWNDDFSAAKNFALDNATGDWIIFLDADEYFDENKVNNLPRIIKALDKSYNSIAIKMINIDSLTGKKLDEITHVRVFRNKKYIRYINPIHEMLINSQKNKNLQAYLTTDDELTLFHTGYSILNRKEKAERNLKLLLNEVEKAEEKPSIYQYLSDCYYGLEDYENAIKYARLFIKSGGKFVGYNVKPHQNIIDSMLRLKYPVEEVYKEILIAQGKFPTHPSFYFYLANLLYDQKKYDDAYKMHIKTLEMQEAYNDIEINSVPSNLYHIYQYLGFIEEYRGNEKKAIGFFLESLKYEKYNPKVFNRLSYLISHYSIEDIIYIINELYNQNELEDLDFLINNLIANYSMKKVVSYYINIRYKKFNREDHWLLYLFLINGMTEKTFNLAYDCYIQDKTIMPYEKLSVISAFVSGNCDYIKRISEQIDYRYKDLYKCILFPSSTNLNTNCYKDIYLEILQDIICFGTDDHLKEFIKINQFFNEDISYEIGNVLLNNRKYEYAINTYLESEKIDNDKNIVFNLGYCFYKLGKLDFASKWFIKAYYLEYEKPEVKSFLKWVYKHIDNINIKNSIKNILEIELEQFKGK